MKPERIRKEVRYAGNTESGMTLFDREGVQYHWVTKQVLHPLFTMGENEWTTVTMTVTPGDWGLTIAKNVRMVKKKTD